MTRQVARMVVTMIVERVFRVEKAMIETRLWLELGCSGHNTGWVPTVLKSDTVNGNTTGEH